MLVGRKKQIEISKKKKNHYINKTSIRMLYITKENIFKKRFSALTYSPRNFRYKLPTRNICISVIISLSSETSRIWEKHYKGVRIIKEQELSSWHCI